VTALAEVIYEILRGRTSLDDPRITYAELAEQVRDAGEEFEYVHHRNRQLYVALTEVGAECRRLNTGVIHCDRARMYWSFGRLYGAGRI
jgi:hypothetical protein